MESEPRILTDEEIDEHGKVHKHRKSKFDKIVLLPSNLTQAEWIKKFILAELSNSGVRLACHALGFDVSAWTVQKYRRELGLSGIKKKRGQRFRNNVLIN